MGGSGRRSRGVCGGARGPFIARAADGLASFCRFWRMTPREVDELTSDEFDAFVRLMKAEDREARKAMAKANRRR